MSENCFTCWGSPPDPLPGFCPWTPLGTSVTQAGPWAIAPQPKNSATTARTNWKTINTTILQSLHETSLDLFYHNKLTMSRLQYRDEIILLYSSNGRRPTYVTKARTSQSILCEINTDVYHICALLSLMSWLHVRQNYFKIFLKLFQCFISLITKSESVIKYFQPLKLFQNYFNDIEHVGKYLWAAISLKNNSEIILCKIISDGRRRRLK